MIPAIPKLISMGVAQSTLPKKQWNPYTNTPHLENGIGKNGEAYYVKLAGSPPIGWGGSITVGGIVGTEYKTGDFVVYMDGVWKHIDNNDEVTLSAFNESVGQLEYDVTQMQTALTTETTNRINGDTTLQTALTTETTDRINTDTILQTALDDEVNDRTAADSELDGKIADLRGDEIAYKDTAQTFTEPQTFSDDTFVTTLKPTAGNIQIDGDIGFVSAAEIQVNAENAIELYGSDSANMVRYQKDIDMNNNDILFAASTNASVIGDYLGTLCMLLNGSNVVFTKPLDMNAQPIINSTNVRTNTMQDNSGNTCLTLNGAGSTIVVGKNVNFSGLSITGLTNINSKPLSTLAKIVSYTFSITSNGSVQNHSQSVTTGTPYNIQIWRLWIDGNGTHRYLCYGPVSTSIANSVQTLVTPVAGVPTIVTSAHSTATYEVTYVTLW